MLHRGRDTVTVSPPTFERTAFARVDARLAAGHAPMHRGWLMARFAEGLQIRMLRPPLEGLVIFHPGKLAWRPIDGVDRALVVQDLRVAPGPQARDGAARLWAVAEDFARYFGLVSVVALVGTQAGLIAPELAPGRGWCTLDQGVGNARLVGRVLQGPIAVPQLPRDWDRRAAALGPGVTIQTTGESSALERRARTLLRALKARGVHARHDRLVTSEAVRARALCPAAVYSVAVDGRFIGGPEVTPGVILDHLGRCQ